MLRLFAATLVLYSHQHALLGIAEPQFFGWNTFGGVGVSIFFFLSGFLVWSSWVRDPNVWRFFVRRSLRIFPGLWVTVLVSVFIVAPILTSLSLEQYFFASQTWRYLSTCALVVRQGLPGVFESNAYPHAFNGSLWTLPVEFFCYVTVAVVGGLSLVCKGWQLVAGLILAMVAAAYGPGIVGERFVPHFEMLALFWWGVWYGHWKERASKSWRLLLGTAALLVCLMLGPRGIEQAAVLLFAAILVIVGQRVALGSRITDHLGDLSYGMYIFAFPVQQMLVELGRGHDWAFGYYLAMSFLVTAGFAYASWHLVEKRALLFKPKMPAPV